MRLTVERLFSDPSLSGRLPTQVRFAPDGGRVAYLARADDDRERLDLWCYDLGSRAASRVLDARVLDVGGGAMTEAEKAERERKRFFAGGITAYQWHPSGRELLLVRDAQAFICSLDGATHRRVTPEGTRQTDIRLSPRGTHVSYVRDGDLFCCDLAQHVERRITDDASETVSNGIADFIAQEEMHRYEGHWWSPDDTLIAFTRVDAATVPVTHRYEIDAERLTVHAQRYPYAGAANAQVSLVLFDRHTGARRTVDYQDAANDYLARIAFGRSVLAVQVQSRNQQQLRVKIFPLQGGDARVAAVETSATWTNLHGELKFVPDTDELILTSERDGIASLYRVNTEGSTRLTPPSFRVNKLLHVAPNRLYFAGWTDRPVEQHLYSLDLDAPGLSQRGRVTPSQTPLGQPRASPRQVTRTPGWHDPVIDPTGRHFLDTRSSVTEPPCMEIGGLAEAAEQAPASIRSVGGTGFGVDHPYWPYRSTHVAPALGTLDAADGQALWYRLVRPTDFDPARRYPAIVNVYGGPGVQRVRDDWAPLDWQLFASAGFVVFELDNRGGGVREKAFEDPLYGRLGAVEVDDQLRGVEFLKQQPWIDGARIGVMGHSYGGFMTLMCMCRAPGTFRAGVAGAPVTDWALYDTHYTERYLGTPQRNAAGYRDSSVLTHADRIVDPLLIIHGMADDNVLFTHSTLLFKALQDRLMPFEMMTYPGAKHALQQRTVAIHRHKTIVGFFKRHLLP